MVNELEKEKEYCDAVWRGAKAIFNANLVHFGEGNVSMRVKKQEELYITPSQNDYATLAPEEIVHMAFDGKQLCQGRPSSSEYRLHVAVYQARPKAQCVIHTHSPYASMLSVIGRSIPVLMEEMLVFLGGGVALAPYGQAGTDDIGVTALLGMGETNGVLMTNHGVLVCGKDMTSAIKNALLVEKMAFVYWGAKQLGEVSIIPAANQAKFLDLFKGMNSTAPRKKEKKNEE